MDAPGSTIRLPLQTGSSALRDVVAAALVSGAVAWLGIGAFFGGEALGISGGSAGLVIASPFVGILILGSALTGLISGLVSARMHRASDLELGADRFVVHGGRKDGLDIAFAELGPTSCSLEPSMSRVIRKYVGQTSYTRAFYIKVQGDIHLVAETAEADEEASIAALVDAIAARLEIAPTLATPTPLLVVCPRCGAPVIPVDMAAAPCAHCDGQAAMPEAVRARLRQSRLEGPARVALARSVARLLAQPGATRINVSLAVVATTFSVAVTVAPILVLTHSVSPAAALVLFALGSLFVARAQIEQRRALRELTIHFAARTTASGASACRACSGPLPAGDSAIATCVYCGAVNVRGLDFGRRAVDERAQEHGLEVDIGRRTLRARIQWALAAAATVAALLAIVR